MKYPIQNAATLLITNFNNPPVRAIKSKRFAAMENEMKIKGIEVPQACIDECRKEMLELGHFTVTDLFEVTIKYNLNYYSLWARKIILHLRKKGKVSSPSTVTTWFALKDKDAS